VLEDLFISDNNIDQKKENETSEKNYKKEQADKNKAGKTITEETSETGTVSCRGLRAVLLREMYFFLRNKET